MKQNLSAIILFLTLLTNYSYSQVILASDTELVFQVQNVLSSQVTKIRYSSVTGTAVVYSNCTYSAFDNFTFTHSIEGENTSTDY